MLTFPCDFPVKVMGEHRDDFAQTILEIVLKHAPDFVGETMEIRASAQSRYLSVTCTVRAVSQEQLDRLYRELTSHPMVKIVL
jgi:putative lipoic acid-binding regulatory protein